MSKFDEFKCIITADNEVTLSLENWTKMSKHFHGYNIHAISCELKPVRLGKILSEI